jgi:hypothetical protein
MTRVKVLFVRETELMSCENKRNRWRDIFLVLRARSSEKVDGWEVTDFTREKGTQQSDDGGTISGEEFTSMLISIDCHRLNNVVNQGLSLIEGDARYTITKTKQKRVHCFIKTMTTTNYWQCEYSSKRPSKLTCSIHPFLDQRLRDNQETSQEEGCQISRVTKAWNGSSDQWSHRTKESLMIHNKERPCHQAIHWNDTQSHF